MEHECCCCFVPYLQDEIAKCNNNHIICKVCINMGTKAAIENRKLFKCPHISICDQFIDEFIINKYVNDSGIIKAYSKMSIFINTINIEGLHQCIYCDYAEIVDTELDVFFCRGCKKEYCFKCSEELHEGKKCKQKFHDETEELTKKYTIYCCGRTIVRGDGCNKLTCNKCMKAWCWYCKIAVNDYTHFTDSNIPVGGKCPLFADPPKPSVIKSDESMEKKQRENQELLRRLEQRRIEEERLRLEQRRIEEEERLENKDIKLWIENRNKAKKILSICSHTNILLKNQIRTNISLKNQIQTNISLKNQFRKIIF
jgi:hypothetical protein